MKYIISRYSQDIIPHPFEDDTIVYDRSPYPLEDSIKVPNIGSDIYDKLTFIIDNYNNLPDVAIYTKHNLFKYITPEEFEVVKYNKTFTPLFTMKHKTYMPTCYYSEGMYYEKNDKWYLGSHPTKTHETADELMELLGIKDMEYIPFAPGSNYILPKANILKHPKDLYIKLRSYLDWSIYPGEAQIMERGLYTLWS
jgi:hypothetical protein